VVEQKLDLHQEDEALEEAMLEMGLLKLVPDSKWKSAESVIEEKEEGDEVGEELVNEDEGNFDYLLSMQMRSMTVKRLKEINKEVQKIREKVEDYQNSTEADLWERDLQSFEVAYAKFLKTRKDL
jgi:ubiquinone biosynthesis protein COQ9